jgi:hypothetical protein
MAANFLANDSTNFPLWKACLTEGIWFLEWLKLLCSGLETVIVGLAIKIELTAIVVEGPQR